MVHVYSKDKNTLHKIQVEKVESWEASLCWREKSSPKLAFQQIPMNLHPK